MLEQNGSFWKEVIFTDKRKLNLCGPDGLDYHWHNLCKEPGYFSKNKHTSERMVWRLICHKKVGGLEGAVGAIDSDYNVKVLEKGLLPVAHDDFGDVWTTQEDNAPNHTGAHAKNWLDANDINVLEWPSGSPNLTINENVWRLLVWLVDKDLAIYDTAEQLTALFLSVGITSICLLLKLSTNLFQDVAFILWRKRAARLTTDCLELSWNWCTCNMHFCLQQ